MPDRLVTSDCSGVRFRLHFGRTAVRADIASKTLSTNSFRLLFRNANNFRVRLGGLSFQKIKQPLRQPAVFAPNSIHLCVAQYFLTLLCDAPKGHASRDPGPPGR